MKKRILTVLLAVCLVFALGTVSALADGTTVTDESTLKSAVEAGGTVVLNNDITITSTLEIKNTVTLDLNGHKLDNNANNQVHTVTVARGGNLTIVDSSENNDGVLDNVTHARGALVVESGGNATLNGGTLKRSQEKGSAPGNNGGNSWYVIQNSGTLTVNNGATVYGTSGYSSLICNKNTMYIYGGIITQQAFIAVKNEATLVVSGGTITSNEQSIQNWGNATISDGTLNGNVYTWGQEGACGHTDITGGTIVGDVYAVNYYASNNDKPTVKVSNATVTGDVASEARNSATEDVEIEIDSSTVYGDINVGGVSTVEVTSSYVDGSVTHTGTGNSTVTGSTVTGTVSDNTVVLSSTINKEYVADRVPDGVKAIIGGRHFETLEAAIAAANNGDTITLVSDVTLTEDLTIDGNKGITINGNNHSIDITVKDSGTTTFTQGISIGSSDAKDTSLTLNNVTVNIDGQNGVRCDAFDVYGKLYINGSTINIDNARSAFTMQGGMDANVVLNYSVVTAENIHGNFSNGGCWELENASIYINGCTSHGLSVETLEATDSYITINGVGLMAIFGSKIDLLGDTNVSVTNSGENLPNPNGGADPTNGYVAPIQVKPTEGAYLNIGNGVTVSLTGNVGLEGANNTIFIPGTGSYTNSGTVNANIVMADAPEGQHSVTVINNGVTTYSGYVAHNGTVTLDTLTRNGYTFGGWRVNGGSVVPGGTVYTITADTTFTAIWNAINIPDTHNITIASTVNGTVSTNFSNASAGSTVTITAAPADGYAVSSVAVTGPDGRVNVTRVDATTYTFVMPDGAVTVSVSFGPATVTLPFTDVNRSQWFYDEVYYVYTNGMMEGDSATTFNPDGRMTRAMFWAVLGRIDGATITGNDWAEEARAWAMREGVSDGTNPNDYVTREQMVTMLWRYAGEKNGSASLVRYTDADKISSYAVEAMRWAIGNGIIEGMTSTTLEPQGTATRAQCAAIFMRFDQM